MNFKIYAHSMTLGVCYGLTALGISVLTGREECQLPKQELRSTRTRVDPLSIDLSGNEKIDTTEVNDKKTPVWFDHNKDGLKEQTGWITNGDGLLARDLNNDGVINNGGELFGEFTLTESGERAYEGIEALTDLDENHDNRIDRNDSAWSSLTVWRDSNTNAITEEGELLSMAQAGISTISLDARSNYTDLGNGNIIYQETTAESDEGKSILIADVNYAVDYYNRIQDSSIKITPEIAQLPNARAFGGINDLRQALVLNPDLKRSLDAFVDEKDASLRNKKLDDLLFHWAGVEQVGEGDPDKFNLQKKAFVQKLSCSTKVMVDNEYRRYKVYAKAQIDAQTRFAEIFRQFVKSPYSSAAPTIIIDFSAFGDFILTSHFARDFSSVSAYLETLFGLTVYSQTLQTQFDLNISSLKPLSRYALIIALTSTRPNDTDRGEYYRRDSGIAVLLDGASFHDTSLDDLFYGSSVNDNFTSSDGNDSLYGGDGNDILNHAVTADDNQQNIVYDNDYFEGGPGKDIYVFTPPGSLVINNNDDSNSKDKLLFEKSIKPSQVKLKKTQKQDLTILFKKHSNSQVTIKNYFLDNGRSAYRLEHIVFNNKTIWTPEDIIAYFTDKTPLPGVNVK
nr:calcium-binding protein [uncultured Enterobacter sp.]